MRQKNGIFRKKTEEAQRNSIERGRRQVLMSTILILSLPSFSPSLERARASRPAAARHDALLGGKSSLSTT